MWYTESGYSLCYSKLLITLCEKRQALILESVDKMRNFKIVQ